MKKKITKRLFTLLLAAMLVFPFASCGGPYPEPVEQEIAFEKISHMLCPGVGKDGMFVFNSRDELETYYEENQSMLGDEFLISCDILGFDTAYFKDHTIVGINVSKRYEVSRVLKKGDEFTFELVKLTAPKEGGGYGITPVHSDVYLWGALDANYDITVSNLKIVLLGETE